jgi:sulfite exporter TauE/SafE
MPCGWLYVFVIAAAGTANPLFGGLLMITFWLGTLPALGSLMLGAAPLGPRLAARIPTVMAVVMIALGIYTVCGRGAIELRADSMPVDGVVTAEDLREVDPHELPCCSDPAE